MWLCSEGALSGEKSNSGIRSRFFYIAFFCRLAVSCLLLILFNYCLNTA